MPLQEVSAVTGYAGRVCGNVQLQARLFAHVCGRQGLMARERSMRSNIARRDHSPLKWKSDGLGEHCGSACIRSCALCCGKHCGRKSDDQHMTEGINMALRFSHCIDMQVCDVKISVSPFA